MRSKCCLHVSKSFCLHFLKLVVVSFEICWVPMFGDVQKDVNKAADAEKLSLSCVEIVASDNFENVNGRVTL